MISLTTSQLTELASFLYIYSNLANLPDWQQKAIADYFAVLKQLSL